MRTLAGWAAIFFILIGSYRGCAETVSVKYIIGMECRVVFAASLIDIFNPSRNPQFEDTVSNTLDGLSQTILFEEPDHCRIVGKHYGFSGVGRDFFDLRRTLICWPNIPLSQSAKTQGWASTGISETNIYPKVARIERVHINLLDAHPWSGRVVFSSSVGLMLLELQGGQQQQTDKPKKTEPDSNLFLIGEPCSDSYGAEQPSTDERKPQIQNIHAAARHSTDWLVLSVFLAALGSGLFIGFAIGRISK